MAGAHVVVGTVGSEDVTTAAAAELSTVDYFGDATTFSVASQSASDNLFGVYTNKGAGGTTVFVKDIGVAVTAGW